MNCANHDVVPAVSVCAACADSFCDDCLIGIGGTTYCGSCKVVAIKNLPPPTEGLVLCKEASEALRLAIFGIFCLGIVLAPIAMMKASRAKQLILADPRLTGLGKVTATYVLGTAELVIWVLGMVSRVAAR